MEFLDLLPHVNRVITQLKAITKKNLLEQMSEIAASHLSVSSDDILQALITREKLGSTGVGNGVAIPHARLPNLLKTYGLFVQLEKSIDFESLDNHPIDLVFLLVTPMNSGGDHLKALAKVARCFKDHALCEKLRHLKDKSEIYQLLVQDPISKAA